MALSHRLNARLLAPCCTFPAMFVFSVRHRNDNRLYWPGGGVRTKKEVEEEAKCLRDGKWPEEHPFEYTAFGNKRVMRADLFHYSDRKAGKGYTDFAETHYRAHGRYYMWPGLRRVRKYHVIILTMLFVPLVVDFKWFWEKAKEVHSKLFSSEAATIEEVDGGESDEKEQKQAEDPLVDGRKSGRPPTTPFDEDEELKIAVIIAAIIAILLIIVANLS